MMMMMMVVAMMMMRGAREVWVGRGVGGLPWPAVWFSESGFCFVCAARRGLPKGRGEGGWMGRERLVAVGATLPRYVALTHTHFFLP